MLTERAEEFLTDRRGTDAELIDRLHALRSILPAMAAEAAHARRESARLRNENTMLQQRLMALETDRSERPLAVVMPLTPGPLGGESGPV